MGAPTTDISDTTPPQPASSPPADPDQSSNPADWSAHHIEVYLDLHAAGTAGPADRSATSKEHFHV